MKLQSASVVKIISFFDSLTAFNIAFFLPLRWASCFKTLKLEQREEGNVNFKYQSAEVRARLPIGKKFSISAGAIYRTHEQPYGYNPIEIWLNEIEEWTNPQTGEVIEYPANPWYSLGYVYGYSDHYTTYKGNDNIHSLCFVCYSIGLSLFYFSVSQFCLFLSFFQLSFLLKSIAYICNHLNIPNTCLLC